jgi:hypothetical protein
MADRRFFEVRDYLPKTTTTQIPKLDYSQFTLVSSTVVDRNVPR